MFGGSGKTEPDRCRSPLGKFFYNRYLVQSFSYLSRPILGTCSLSNGWLYVNPYERHTIFYAIDLVFLREC